jgi:isocitrate dehydrogenase kinase/phosphatase
VRKCFLEYHADLLDADWWQSLQATIGEGALPEVLSYPEKVRFSARAPSP